MKRLRRVPAYRHVILIADTGSFAMREVFLGVAEILTARHRVCLDIWPITLDKGPVPPHWDIKQMDGLLVARLDAGFIRRRLHERRVPAVYFFNDSETPRHPSVGFDERAIGRMAFEHLYERGYRHFGFVGTHDRRWSCLRGDGFQAAARDAGMTCRAFTFSTSDFPVYWSPMTANLRPIFDALPHPCGLFAANDVMASSLVEYARTHGLAIPEQVGIVGVDDDPVANAAAGISISTVQVPFREVGRRVADMLLGLWRNEQPAQPVHLPPVRVIVRASSNSFLVEDNLVRRAQIYIEERLGQRVRVQDVVRAVHTTAVTLRQHFVRHLKQEPSDYIWRRRMGRARELLREGRHSVQDVAAICNFHSCAYFCAMFRKATGTTPGEIRREAAGTATAVDRGRKRPPARHALTRMSRRSTPAPA